MNDEDDLFISDEQKNLAKVKKAAWTGFTNFVPGGSLANVVLDQNELGDLELTKPKYLEGVPFLGEMLNSVFDVSGEEHRKNKEAFNQQVEIPQYSSGDIVQTESGPLYRAGDIVSNEFQIDLGASFPGKAPKNETYAAYFNRMMNQYGARLNENGELVMSSDAFRNIKNDNIRREIAQMLLTDINKGVKGSFLKEKNIKNPKFNKDLAKYNKKYASRADLHHEYPSVIGIDFYLDAPFMGERWQKFQTIAAKYGNVPGQPMLLGGESNLTAMPSRIPSTQMGQPNPDYQTAVTDLEAVGRKVPKHLHQIIHNEFLVNEMGQKGEKFWAKWNPIIDAEGEAGWEKAYEAYNEIIARNRDLTRRALKQLDVLFSTGSLSNDPEALTDMLEEYIGTGKITIGSGQILDKEGNTVMQEGTLGPKIATYAQDAVNYHVADIFADFKKDAKEKILGKNYLDVKQELEIYPQLSEKDFDDAAELLYQIRRYNSILLTDGARRANYVTGITKEEHKGNMKKYYDIIQLQIFSMPRGSTNIPLKKNIQSTVFKGTKKVDINKQLEFILDYD
tara:strand:+ start:64 stop:1752 length:1689 start_codon:yes stop_codon:yes gene_type:complete